MRAHIAIFLLFSFPLYSTANSEELEYGSYEWIENMRGPGACSITPKEIGFSEKQITLFLMRDILNFVAEKNLSHTYMVVSNFRVFSMTHEVSPSLTHLRNIAQLPIFNQRIIADIEAIETELERTNDSKLSKSATQIMDTYIFCQVWALLNNESPDLDAVIKNYGANVVNLPE